MWQHFLPQIIFCSLYVLILFVFIDYDLNLLQYNGIFQCIIFSISMYMTLGHISWTSTTHRVNKKYIWFYYTNRLMDIFMHAIYDILYAQPSLNDPCYLHNIHFLLCIHHLLKFTENDLGRRLRKIEFINTIDGIIHLFSFIQLFLQTKTYKFENIINNLIYGIVLCLYIVLRRKNCIW